MAQLSGLGIERRFTKSKTKAYDSFTWHKRDSVIMNPMTGKPVIEQRDIEFPEG